MNFDFPLEICRRPYQRSVNILVKPNGVVKVTAGKRISQQFIAKFIYAQKDWVFESLARCQEVQKRYPIKTYEAGESFLFLGEQLQLVIEPTNKARPRVERRGFELVVQWPEAAESKREAVRDAVLKFYKDQAQTLMRKRVEHYSQRMKLYPKRLSFRSQKTRWGSCNSLGHISLNWRLIAAPVEILDYVIVHEMAHLEHQNHSARFWSLVDQHCEDHKAKRRWLKDHQYEFDFLAKKSELHLTQNG